MKTQPLREVSGAVYGDSRCIARRAALVEIAPITAGLDMKTRMTN